MPPKAVPKTVSKAVASAGDSKQPTAQEAYLFYTIIKNMKGKPEIDWTAVATDAGYKTAETAKVRYGQIKRKLGLDNWTAGKPKDPKDDDAAGDDGGPETPGTSRTKKTTTPGTGAGVKKRASVPKRTPGSRSRKAKSDAIIKMEDDAAAADDDDSNDRDELMITDQVPATPTKKRKTGRATAANRNKTDPAGGNALDDEDAASFSVMDEFVHFPAVLPDSVLERQAILVDVGGVWTASPVPIDAHAQWLARLPATLQTRFYAQAHNSAAPGAAASTNPYNNKKKNGVPTTTRNGNGNNAHANFILPEEEAAAEQDDEDEQQLAAGQHYTGLPGIMSMGLGGYLSSHPGNGNAALTAAAVGVGIDPDDVDLHSIPMHPGYFAEQMERRQEARDHEMLFGGGGGGDGMGDDGQDGF